MPAYHFEASNIQGHLQKGILEADSPRHLRQQLKDRGLTLIEFTPLHQSHHSASSHVSWWTAYQSRLSTQDLALLIRQLASLIQAGLPIDEALLALSEQAERPSIRHLLTTVRSEILGGHPLSTALAQHPNTFPSLMYTLVLAGEHSGQLSLILAKLADYFETRHQLQSKVGLALIYPTVVTLTALIIVTFLLSYVVPQVVSVFIQTQQTLPLLTRVVMSLSNGIREWGIVGIILLLVSALGLRRALQIPHLCWYWHQWQLKLPLIGSLIRGYNTARFASTLAILTRAGVPILQALRTAADTLNNMALKKPMDEVITRVQEGSSLTRALSAQHFAPVLIHLIRSGEATGQLPQMLEEAARGESAAVERKTLSLTSLLEPILILIMGLIVLLIVLAVMMPIIELNQGIR